MKSYFSKKNILISLCLVAFIFLLSIGTKEYQEKKNYEEFLSHELSNRFSRVSSGAALSSKILDDAIQEQSVNKVDYGVVENGLIAISQQGHFFYSLADHSLGRIDHSGYPVSPYPTYMAVNFSRYLDRLEEKLAYNEDTDEYTIPDSELEKLAFIQKISEIWTYAMIENFEGLTEPKYGAITTDLYFDTYRDSMVNGEDWIKAIIQMQEETYEFQQEYEILFE